MSKSITRVSVVVPNGAGAGVAIAGLAISRNTGVHQGDIILFKIVTPNFTLPITCVVSLLDKNGVPKWTSDALAENITHAIYPAVGVPIESSEYFTVTPSADPTGTGGTVTIDAEYRPDVFINL